MKDVGRSAHEPRPESQTLDAVVREAQGHLVPGEVDWSSLEAKLMDRIARDPSPVLEEPRSPARARALRVGAVLLAAAAAIALTVRRDRDVAPLDAPFAASAAVAPTPGSFRGSEGPGEVRIAGIQAAFGQVLRPGDVIEAEGARGVFERPRKVNWLLEHDTPGNVARARVELAGESLVLALDSGAVEAQVTPVPTGEAFAVDIPSPTGAVRVAVHGTHLRVARSGTRVTVDLTEGVVSIGAPPRAGSTYGTLVTAPAHVEFDAANLGASLRIDHALATVRAAVPLGVQAQEPPPPPARPEAGGAVAARPAPSAAPTQQVGQVGQVARVAMAPPAEPVARSAPAAAPAASARPRGRDAITAAVRACASAHGQPGAVRVTVTSSLTLQVGAGGEIQSAQFDPPLQPEIQSCAADAIYRTTKLDEAGPVTIPLEFSY